jgi:micrococcal nuclease
MKLATVLCIVPFFALAWGPQTTLRGKVIHIANGDTINIRVGPDVVNVRLEGIDAPNFDQPFGAKATTVLKNLIYDKDVVVIVSDTDSCERKVGIVTVDGVNVNTRLVQEGLAWHYKRYTEDPKFGAQLESLEGKARLEKRGLWADSNPIAPWRFEDQRTLQLLRIQRATSTDGAK